MIEVRLKLKPEDEKWLKDLSGNFRDGFLDGFRKAILFVKSEAMKRAPVKTGHLRRSLQHGVSASKSSASGYVGSDVAYAAIRELGGTIKPKTKDYLRFQVGGQWKTVKQVVQKARPYLAPAFTENLEKIEQLIQDSILEKTK